MVNKIIEEDLQNMHIRLVAALRDYFGKAGFTKAVVGLSGGIDSSLTLFLAVDALGAENVTGIIMPELGLSSRENIEDAQNLAASLSVNTLKVPINRFIQEYDNLPWISGLAEFDSEEVKQGVRLAKMNVKSRVRANILYSFANTFQALVLGTSNLSETRLGYGTKHGDLAADVEVIGALYKTQVRALAGYLGIPAKIIDKAPTAELEAGQSDANELGADYAELDTILVYGPNSIELGADPTLIKHVAELERKSMHKREMPPIISYTEDAY